MAINFSGFLFDDAGSAINGATVNLYDINSTTPVRATTTTNSNGYWAISHGTAGEFDVEITSGSSVRRIKGDDSRTYTEITLADNNRLTFGSGGDADIYYDGTDLVVDPDVVGSGVLNVLGDLQVTNSGSADGALLELENADTAVTDTEVLGRIDWRSNDSSTNAAGVVARISVFADGVFGDGVVAATHMSFHTNTGNAGSLAEIMRLTDNYNLFYRTTTEAASAQGVIHIGNATAAPTGSIANGCLLYAEDVTSSSELRTRDEAGNITTISPHAFTLFTPDDSYEYPWSYRSVNAYMGREINVDMFGAIRAIEQLTGKQFIYLRDLDPEEKEDPSKHEREFPQWTKKRLKD